MPQLQPGIDQYNLALKAGQKYYRSCIQNSKYPYLPVLDEITETSLNAGFENIGIIDIPSELIVGTKTAGRRSSFAGNFMPLLPVASEFGSKWVNLCAAHLGDEGIRDPITCYEYLGKFYVEEGNKRVSVLKSFGAPMITGKVVRILPEHSYDPAIQLYYEFMQFYRCSHLYLLQFTRPGSYAKLQAALGFDPDHQWTEEERRAFSAQYVRFRTLLQEKNIPAGLAPADVLLVWFRTNDYRNMKQMTSDALSSSIDRILPDLKVLSDGSPIDLKTGPAEAPQESFFSRLIGSSRPTHLNIAFVHSADPETSPWVKGHEMGRRYLDETLGSAVTTRSYVTTVAEAETVLDQAVADGAQVVFGTTPQLISACLRLAPRYPNVHFLNCALSMPFTSVRTYYGRIYEAKFITGAIAGAMCRDDTIGYIANYPIFGTAAAVNAFALGAQLTHPGVKIKLRWSCLPGDPVAQFTTEGVRIISNRDTVENERRIWTHHWGTYERLSDGSTRPLTSSCWNWGKLYAIIVESIFSGGWRSADPSIPVNYWWGFNSGVIDVEISSALPDGIRHLASILKQGIKTGTLEPFHCRILDQSGQLRNNGDAHFTAEEIMRMDWLCDCVEGSIPAFDELIPQAREVVRLLGVHRDQIPPEKEGLIL